MRAPGSLIRAPLAVPLLAGAVLAWAPLAVPEDGSGDGKGGFEMLSPKEGAIVGSGAVAVTWRPCSAATAAVSVSVDGGRTWREAASRPSEAGLFMLETGGLPEGVPVRVRLRLAGPGGPAEAEASFTVDRTPPSARVIGPESADSAKVAIEVASDDGRGSGIDAVEVWATLDGRNWFLAAASREPAKRVPWTAPHRGIWGLYAVAKDRAGNAGRSPGPGTAPQLRVPVRTPEPWISRFAVDAADLVVPGGHPLPLAWNVEGDDLPERPVVIEAQSWVGAGDRKWVAVAGGLPAKGRTAWKVPARSGPVPLLRLRAAGARREAVKELQAGVFVDADPPRVALQGPALWMKPGPAALEADVRDEYSGVQEITLWWRNPQSGKWLPLKRFGPFQGVTFKEIDGCHALWLSAVDALGNASAAPGPTDAPMLELMIDREPPDVTLVAPLPGERCEPGAEVRVSWSVLDANLKEGSVCVQVSRDGKAWETLRGGLPNDGDLPWRPAFSGRAWIRILAEDRAGRHGQAVLARPLEAGLGGAPPAVPALEGLPQGPVAAGRDLALRWAKRDRGLTVRMSWSADESAWEEIGEAPADAGAITWPVPSKDMPSVRLRLALLKGAVVLGTSETPPFAVSATPPRLRIVAPEPLPEP